MFRSVNDTSLGSTQSGGGKGSELEPGARERVLKPQVGIVNAFPRGSVVLDAYKGSQAPDPHLKRSFHSAVLGDTFVQ